MPSSLRLTTAVLLMSFLSTACGIHTTAPKSQPHSAMLAHSTTHTLQTQHQRAQLFTEDQTSTKRASSRSTPAKRPPRPRKQPTAAKKSRPLPSLSTLKREATPKPKQDALVAALHAHISSHGSALKGKQFSSLAQLHKHCKKLDRVHFKKLEAHDIVFFHNTHDANDDGRNNDWYTYAAIVHTPMTQTRSASLKDLTRSDTPIALSLAYPDMYTTEGGAVLNTHVRQPRKRDLPYTRYLAGELFAGACRI